MYPQNRLRQSPHDSNWESTLETTFEESRAHLGTETQRQWSDAAIERETPCLFGLSSVGDALRNGASLPLRTAAWSRKTEATFADILATVRHQCWGPANIPDSEEDPRVGKIPRSLFERLMNTACYAHY